MLTNNRHISFISALKNSTETRKQKDDKLFPHTQKRKIQNDYNLTQTLKWQNIVDKTASETPYLYPYTPYTKNYYEFSKFLRFEVSKLSQHYVFSTDKLYICGRG